MKKILLLMSIILLCLKFGGINPTIEYFLAWIVAAGLTMAILNRA